MNRSYPALRGVAILLVILNHTIHMVTKYAAEAGLFTMEGRLPLALSVISGLGVFAVPIFLFLSGAFFAYAAGRKDLKTDYKVVWSNVRHVAVPYLVWSVIFYLEIFVLHGERFSPLGYVKNLLVGYPFNFVPLLIFYYLAAPLLIRLLRRYGAWVLLAIGAYQALLLALVGPRELGFTAPGWMQVFAPPVISAPLAQWGIFFPLGLYIGLKGEFVRVQAVRYRWALTALLVVFFVLGTLSALSILVIPFIRQFTPLPLLLLSAGFERGAIPAVRSLELIGKRAYGLYLTNLLVLDLGLFAIRAVAPGLLGYVLLLIPVMYALALFIPLWIMTASERRMKPALFRYAFG